MHDLNPPAICIFSRSQNNGGGSAHLSRPFNRCSALLPIKLQSTHSRTSKTIAVGQAPLHLWEITQHASHAWSLPAPTTSSTLSQTSSRSNRHDLQARKNLFCPQAPPHMLIRATARKNRLSDHSHHQHATGPFSASGRKLLRSKSMVSKRSTLLQLH